jgi:hypothetical protein
LLARSRRGALADGKGANVQGIAVDNVALHTAPRSFCTEGGEIWTPFSAVYQVLFTQLQIYYLYLPF